MVKPFYFVSFLLFSVLSVNLMAASTRTAALPDGRLTFNASNIQPSHQSCSPEEYQFHLIEPDEMDQQDNSFLSDKDRKSIDKYAERALAGAQFVGDTVVVIIDAVEMVAFPVIYIPGTAVRFTLGSVRYLLDKLSGAIPSDKGLTIEFVEVGFLQALMAPYIAGLDNMAKSGVRDVSKLPVTYSKVAQGDVKIREEKPDVFEGLHLEGLGHKIGIKFAGGFLGYLILNDANTAFVLSSLPGDIKARYNKNKSGCRQKFLRELKEKGIELLDVPVENLPHCMDDDFDWWALKDATVQTAPSWLVAAQVAAYLKGTLKLGPKAMGRVFSWTAKLIKEEGKYSREMGILAAGALAWQSSSNIGTGLVRASASSVGYWIGHASGYITETVLLATVSNLVVDIRKDMGKLWQDSWAYQYIALPIVDGASLVVTTVYMVGRATMARQGINAGNPFSFGLRAIASALGF